MQLLLKARCIRALSFAAIAVAVFAFQLPATSEGDAVTPSDALPSDPGLLTYAVTALTLDHGEYSYSYRTSRKSQDCSVIKSGKNKGKLRCCSVITSGKDKGKKRCTISNAPRNPGASIPDVDPTLDSGRQPSPDTPQRPEPKYDVDPSLLQFEGPLMGAENEFSFMSFGSNGVPARWNKCDSVRYRVNPRGLPSTALEDIHEAIRRLSLASQINFEYIGSTDVLPYIDGNWYENIPAVERRSTELWIAYSSEATVAALVGPIIGVGGPVWQESRRGNSDARIVGAGIVFDVDPSLEAGFGTGSKRGSLMLHELGHVMNLGHVADPVQMMFPTLLDDTKSMFQNGDLAGFRHLHSYPCF